MAVLACLALATACGRPATPTARELWLWSGLDVSNEESVTRMESVWRRAAAAGYSTVVLADVRFSRLASQPPEYFARLERLKALAAELRLELVPALFPVGRGQGAALSERPELVEALPVRGALFEVRGGVAQPVNDPPIALPEAPDSRDDGASWTGGAVAIRDARRPTRAAWNARVAPHRVYRLSFEYRTERFEGPPAIKVRGRSSELAYASLRAKGDRDWTRFDVAFNSLGEDGVRIHLGTGGATEGTIAFRRPALEECGPVNLVRRGDTPFTAEGMVESRDFEPVRDSLMGASPWRGQFDAWHAPPAIRVHRPDGTRFRASWWHAAVLLRGQVAMCLADTGTRAQLADEARRVREAFGARTYLIQHDEIRVLGRDPACEASGVTAGALLAANAKLCRELLAPARVCAWNDMFDPHHNAVKDYFLVRGDLAGSWDGLDSSVVILNWNAEKLRESLAFFSKRGHRQVFAGYYDGRPEELRRALPALDRTPGVIGVMYTTWQDRYDDLEAFARIARERR